METLRSELLVTAEDCGSEGERGKTRRLNAEDGYDPPGGRDETSCPGHSCEARIASRQ